MTSFQNISELFPTVYAGACGLAGHSRTSGRVDVYDIPRVGPTALGIDAVVDVALHIFIMVTKLGGREIIYLKLAIWIPFAQPKGINQNSDTICWLVVLQPVSWKCPKSLGIHFVSFFFIGSE